MFLLSKKSHQSFVLFYPVVVAYLLETDDLDCIMEPEEFMNLYEHPFDVTLASGQYGILKTKAEIEMSGSWWNFSHWLHWK